MCADATDEIEWGPLVDDDEVCAVEHSVDIERRALVAARLERGVVLERQRERLGAMIALEVPYAPRIRRLENADAMAALNELGHDATEEMRTPVVPVRQERMTEEDDAHDQATSPRESHGLRRHAYAIATRGRRCSAHAVRARDVTTESRRTARAQKVRTRPRGSSPRVNARRPCGAPPTVANRHEVDRLHPQIAWREWLDELITGAPVTAMEQVS
jgi:hypothetical protein